MKTIKPLPPVELLDKLFTYSIITGQLFNSKGRSNKRLVSVAGYGQFMIHRIIWCIVTGVDPGPNFEVDHINKDRTNNAWHNLRLLSHSNNRVNSGRVMGVCWHKHSRKWIAQKVLMGKTHTLGYYNTREDACQAAQDWDDKHRPGINVIT